MSSEKEKKEQRGTGGLEGRGGARRGEEGGKKRGFGGREGYRGDTRSVRSWVRPKGHHPDEPHGVLGLRSPPPSALREFRALYHTLVTCTFAPWRVSRDEEIWPGPRENGVIIYEGGKKEGVNQNGAVPAGSPGASNTWEGLLAGEEHGQLVICSRSFDVPLDPPGDRSQPLPR